MGETYAAAGVDIDAGEDAVRRIAPLARATYRPEVVGDLGGFGGLFDVAALGYDKPILVSATDGVGTKALVAQAARSYRTIGLDLVAMCVDDIVCSGAEPLFFLDYVSVGSLDPDQMEDLVAGVADGCTQAGCSLIGGEMAEHPGVMQPGEFDLVGFVVGVVERDQMITGEHAAAGDVLIGLPSPGLRSNGFSLARRLLFDIAGRSLDEPAYDGATTTLAEELLIPSVIYTPAIRSLTQAVDVRSVAHVTGGGLPGNLPRVLPDGTDAVVDMTTWEIPRMFGELQAIGDVSDDEMAKTFNLGIGMVVVVPEADATAAVADLEAHGVRGRVIGEIAEGSGDVQLTGR